MESPHRGGLALARISQLPREAFSGAPSLALDDACSLAPNHQFSRSLNYPFSRLFLNFRERSQDSSPKSFSFVRHL